MLQPKYIDWLNGYKSKPVDMLSSRMQTDSEGMEKGIPCRWKSKENWSSKTHIRQNRF